MKKIVILSAIALILFPAAILFAVNAEIKNFTGKVEIQAPGSAAWTAVTEGQVLKTGTIISTGFNANATIDMGKTSEILVRPLTRVAIEDLTVTAGVVKTNLNLKMGKIKADVKTTTGLKHNFTLKTPISTAAVRGTVFEAGVSNISVETGSVGFSNSIGQTVNVASGASASNTGGGYATPESAAVAVLTATTVTTTTAPVVAVASSLATIGAAGTKKTVPITVSWNLE